MLRRVAEHYVGIKKQSGKKYRILAEAQRKGHQINFDVLYDTRATSINAIADEIGRKEGELIRLYRPILNTQIPKETNWSRYNHNAVNAKEILSQF